MEQYWGDSLRLDVPEEELKKLKMPVWTQPRGSCVHQLPHSKIDLTVKKNGFQYSLLVIISPGINIAPTGAQGLSYSPREQDSLCLASITVFPHLDIEGMLDLTSFPGDLSTKLLLKRIDNRDVDKWYLKTAFIKYVQPMNDSPVPWSCHPPGSLREGEKEWTIVRLHQRSFPVFGLILCLRGGHE